MPNNTVAEMADFKDALSVSVTNGVTQSFDFDPGSTLADVRRRAADVLNIAPGAVAEVCFSEGTEFTPQEEGYVLQKGDEVQYQKPSGEKG